MLENKEDIGEVVGIRHALGESGFGQLYRPLHEHVGPFHRTFHAGKESPGHQRVLYHCSSNPAECPACYAEALAGHRMRLGLLATADIYLEIHIVETEREVSNLQTAARRRTGSTGALVTIPVKNNRFYVLTPIRLGGRELARGEDRVRYLDRLAERAMNRPRKKGEHALRFNHSWPHLEEAPKKFDHIGSSPDCAEADLGQDELIGQDACALKACGQTTAPGMVFNQRTGGGVRVLDFWVPPDVLADPRRHVRIHLALGFHLSPVFYARTRKWGEEQLRKGEERAA